MDGILAKALDQGLGYALFVILLFYVLKQQEKRDIKSELREQKYQNIIEQLTSGVVGKIDNITEVVKEILNRGVNK